MESFSVTSDLAREDWNALMRAVHLRMQERMRRGSLLVRWAPLLVAVAVMAGICFTAYWWPGAIQVESLVLGFLLMLAFMAFIAAHGRRAQAPADDGSFYGRTEFRFAPEGISISRERSNAHSSWALVREISYTPAHVYLWIDNLAAYTFRVADLPAALTVDEAVARLRAFKAASSATAAAAAPADDAAMPAASDAPIPVAALPPRPTVWQELKALLRLEMLRGADPAHLFGRDATILMLGALALVAWIGLDRLDYGPDAEIMWFGLSAIGTSVSMTLLLAWVLSRLSSPQLPMRRTLLLTVAGSPLVVVIGWLITHTSPSMYYMALIVLVTWLAFLVHSGLRAMTGRSQWRAVGGTTATFLLLVYLSAWFFPGGPDLWYEPDSDYDTSSAEFEQREKLQFEQAPRIDAALARLPAGDPAQAAMYFVGFAGYGQQRVFAEEIGTAARVVGEKYSLGGRELRLINDQRDETTWPAASGTALRHALVGLGQRMNRDNDVLFLALSSHGGEDATLSVMNDSLSLWRDLDATELRAMLQESGIRWRVIVISACHAGSFIDSLADENTIVLTAAAKQNTSFGCSDDRDLTYFGEAFYRDALPKAASLREAFEQARVAIAAREKKEGVDESDPQAYFGAALEAKLAQMSGEPVASAQGR